MYCLAYSPFFSFLKSLLLFAAQGLCGCEWAFSSCGEQGSLFFSILRLLITGASLAVVVVGPRLNCSPVCGIFRDQGSNLCPLYWWADSYPLYHQGNPSFLFPLYSTSVLFFALNPFPTPLCSTFLFSSFAFASFPCVSG